MANPLDGLTQDQSGDDDTSLPRRVYIYGDGQSDQGGTPYQPQTINAPLAQAVAPEQPSNLMAMIGKLRDYVNGAPGTGNADSATGDRVVNRLLGTSGEQRYQTWPERMVREGLSAPGDVLASTTPSTSESLIAPAQSVAALAGGGALTETPGVGSLGSGPLRTGAKAMSTEPAPVFYSALEHAVENSSQKSASPEQWLGTLKNTPGVKQEELAWSGVGDWLKGQKGKVSKEDVQSYLDANKTDIQDVTKQSRSYEDLSPAELEEAKQAYKDDNGIEDSEPVVWNDVRDYYEEMQAEREDVGVGGGTKYSQYQLPGGENYREHLLTLPERDNRDPNMTLAQYEAQNYNSSHWDEPNVLAHVRTNDREVGGKKSLHIEEIQSDWHQQGRKQGYTNKKPEGYTARQVGDEMHVFDPGGKHVGTMDPALGQQGAINAVIGHQGKAGVPDAPFKTTWPELALKRMIRHAAENGYDRVSWTPGEAQAARYDLSKQLDNLAYSKDGVLSGSKDGKSVMKQAVPEDKLADFVGKDAAEKLIKQEANKHGTRELSGLDLKVGGEGMREFYDKMLPKMVEKIGKSHGVKVKQGEVSSGTSTGYEGPELTPEQLHNMDGVAKRLWPVLVRTQLHDVANAVENGMPFKQAMTEHGSAMLAGKVGGKQVQSPKGEPVHYFDLPQSLKDHAIGKGFPLYMRGLPFPLKPVDGDPFKKKEK